MAELNGGPITPASPPDPDEPISGFAVATVLLRWRWLIVGLAVMGAGIGLARGLSSTRVYKSIATFIPQGAAGSSSGLAQAVSQFGISVPSSGGAWTPQMYVELIESRAVLAPIVLDTVVVREEGGKRITLIDLLEITGPNQELRVSAAVRSIGGMIEAKEERKLGAVTVAVATPWPSVSLAIADRLLDRVNRFNIEIRKSQALAEREFVERQTVEAEVALLDAENRLQAFLQRNRDFGGSPGLIFERDRLQREVVRLNEVYTSWLKSREDARIREIRDTPVITVLEEPLLPVIGEPRKSLTKGVMWGATGLILGALAAFVIEGLAMARRSQSPEAREFFQALSNATPAFLKRRRA